MASNFIDLVSSSPPRPSAPGRRRTQQPTLPAAAAARHVDILSDDFRSSDDDASFRNASSVIEPSAKRPRLSAEGATRHSGRPATSTALTQSSRTNASRPRPLPEELIECMSSIEADLEFTSPLPRNTSGLKRTRTEPTRPSSGLFIPDSDPFASSPPPARTAATHACAPITSELLPDPFASSPAKAPPGPSRTASNTTFAPHPTRPLKHAVAAWDPISSSAPCSSAPTRPNPAQVVRESRSPSVISIGDTSNNSSDDELPAIDTFDLSQGRPAYHDYLSSAAQKSKPTNKWKSKPSEPRQSKPRQAGDSGKRAAAKALQKEERRQEREREKEARQRQRDIAAAIVEVNKAKGNRKVSTKEMIVHLPSSLCSTIKLQLQTLLDGLEVQHEEYPGTSQHVIKWQRKINSKFDDESGQWVPMPLRIEAEEHALVVMTAEEVVQLAVDDGIDQHVRSLRQQLPDEKIIHVLQGVTTWMRKNRNIRNRQFAAGVRLQQEDSQAPAGRRRNNEQASYIDEDVVEDAILHLQVEHDVLIHHTAIPLETAQWISIFTQNISTIPYKKQKDEDTAGARFCMDSGQVKTGENTQDTYVRMLQEIFRVTAPIAYGVASEFSTVTKLVEGLEARGPNALEGLRKSANKDGAYSDRMIGQAVSKRFYKIFTGTDETSTDV